MYSRWGATPAAVVLGLARHPIQALSAMFVGGENAGFDTVLKLQYCAHMLGPFLFLPLASPLTLAIAVPTLATHFLSWRPAQHTILYQYTALVTPFVVAAAVLGLAKLLRRAGSSARPAPRGQVEPLGATRAAHLTMVALLAASVIANWMFGPLMGHGDLQMVRAEERIAPNGKDRALTRARDR